MVGWMAYKIAIIDTKMYVIVYWLPCFKIPFKQKKKNIKSRIVMIGVIEIIRVLK